MYQSIRKEQGKFENLSKPKTKPPIPVRRVTKQEKIKIGLISGLLIVALGGGVIWYTIWLYFASAPFSVILSIFLMLGAMIAAIAHLAMQRIGILDEFRRKKQLGTKESIPVKINGKLTMI